EVSTGRWFSEDPIGFAAGDANLYRYVTNQTTTQIDPTGLEGEASKVAPPLQPLPGGSPFGKVFTVSSDDPLYRGPYSPFARVGSWWKKDSNLDAKLAELQEKQMDREGSLYKAPAPNSNLIQSWQQQVPGFRQNWKTGVGQITVLANVGIIWTTGGP